MRTITEVIIHCSATRVSWYAGETLSAKRDEIRRWHVQERGWSDIGYHYIIDRDGSVVPGRPVELDGAHVAGHNKGTIGVCLIGGFGANATDQIGDHFTPVQERSLLALLDRLKSEYPTISKVSGHNQYAKKGCPGFDVQKWLGAAPKERTHPAQSTTIQAAGIVSGIGGVGAAGGFVANLDPIAQIVLIAGSLIIIAAGLYIMRERLKKWADGIK